MGEIRRDGTVRVGRRGKEGVEELGQGTSVMVIVVVIDESILDLGSVIVDVGHIRRKGWYGRGAEACEEALGLRGSGEGDPGADGLRSGHRGRSGGDEGGRGGRHMRGSLLFGRRRR
jgi:hypothetical protein